jgi:hypothetical protein
VPECFAQIAQEPPTFRTELKDATTNSHKATVVSFLREEGEVGQATARLATEFFPDETAEKALAIARAALREP